MYGTKQRSADFEAAVCSDVQEPHILMIGRKEDSVFEMNETQVMSPATSHGLLSKKPENDDAFGKELCNACVGTAG